MAEQPTLTIDLTIRQGRRKTMRYSKGPIHDGLYYAAFHLTAEQRQSLIERLTQQQAEAETRFR